MDHLPTMNLPTQPPTPPPIPTSPIPPPSSNSKTKLLMVGGLSLGVIIILFSFYIFRSTLFPPAPKVAEKQNPPPTSTSQRANPLFDSQTATINGTITKINGSTLSVTNDKGISGDFPISRHAIVYSYDELNRIASPSADLKSIDTGKPVIISLIFINGEYQVTSILPQPSPPLLPKPAR